MSHAPMPPPGPLRVLLLEDSAPDAELAIALLEKAGFACAWERVATRDDLLERLGARPWDLVLADHSLPGFNGIAALHLVREASPDLPFIFVSGTIGEETAIESFRAGATDYVLKDRLARLVPVVARALGEREERRRCERAEAEQREEAEVAETAGRVAHELIAGLAAPDLLERLCRVTADVLRCDVCCALLARPAKRLWVPIAACGWTAEERRVAREIAVPEEVMAGLLARLEHDDVVEVGTPGSPGPPSRLGLPELGDTAQLCTALRRGEELGGVLIVHRRGTSSAFTPLEHRIAHEIGHLASLVLENARSMEAAQEARRLKSDFVATLSHELRTPLNVILGYSTLLLEGDFGAVSAEQDDALRRVEANAQALAELVCNMLDLGRLESRRQPLAVSEVRVEQLVGDLQSETDELQRKPGVSFAWRVDPALPVLRTDRAKLKVLLKSLLSNAVKFTDAGSVALHARRGEVGGVEISVVDTGVGIPAEVLPFIFEPFRQGESAMTRRFGGVGLGLYIARQLADLIGARIDVESAPGRGSTFRVTLPAGGDPDGEPGAGGS